MTLLDLISAIDENKHCAVWYGDRIVSRYDGKDSIDERLNDFPVSGSWIDFDNVPNVVNIELAAM